MTQQSWTIGILCYNEAGTIRQEVEKTLGVLHSMASHYEVIVVDDGSKDGSTSIVQQLSEEYPEVKAVIFETNKGIGAGLNTIYATAQYENVLATAGDGQFDVNELLPFASFPANGFVSFYRMENTIYNGYRNVLSFVNKKLNQQLLGITVKDVNWAQVYKTAHLRQIDISLKSSLVGSEICAKLIYLGVQAIHQQSRYLPRTYGESKGSNFKTVIKAFKDILILLAIMRRFRKTHKAKQLAS